MKIGLSYSRCVRDIVDGNIDIDDVLVIISRTDFDPTNDDQWAGIWQGYHGYSPFSNPEWASYPNEDEDKFRTVSIDLWNQGKLHQPRKFGAHPRRLPYIWVETVLPSEELDKNPTLKGAWDKFQNLAQLTSTSLEERH
jgi:hypothetical protein